MNSQIEHGFKGKLETLAMKANLTLIPNNDREKNVHPDYIVMHGQHQIGVAWNRHCWSWTPKDFAEDPTRRLGGLVTCLVSSDQ